MAERVLIAEDEFFAALDLCDIVEDAGFTIQGLHPDVRSATLSVEKSKPDLAILDVNLEDGKSLAFAKLLMDGNVPVIIHSGVRDSSQIENQVPGVIVRDKPCPPNEMLKTIRQVLSTT